MRYSNRNCALKMVNRLKDNNQYVSGKMEKVVFETGADRFQTFRITRSEIMLTMACSLVCWFVCLLLGVFMVIFCDLNSLFGSFLLWQVWMHLWEWDPRCLGIRRKYSYSNHKITWICVAWSVHTCTFVIMCTLGKLS